MALRIVRKGNTGLSNDHNLLINRGEKDQHPIQSISGLREELDTKYTMPMAGIPRRDLSFEAASIDDVISSQNIVQANIDEVGTELIQVDIRTTALEDYISNLDPDNEGSVILPGEINSKFEIRNHFEVIAIEEQDTFHLPFEYTVGNDSLEIYMDGVLQILNTHYTEVSPSEVWFYEKCYGEEHLVFKTGSKTETTSPIHESLIYDGLEEVTLEYKYQVGDNSLSVYHNGKRLDVGYDYEEVSPFEIRITNAEILSGDRLTFRRETHRAAKTKVAFSDSSFQTWKETISIETDNATTVTFSKSYLPGGGMLQVFCNGLIMDIGSDDDYLETGEKEIVFNYGLDIGDEVKAVCNAGLMEWRETFVSLDGKNTFRLSNPYNPEHDELEVYENGVLLCVDEDYIENNRTTITIKENPENGSKIIIYRRR